MFCIALINHTVLKSLSCVFESMITKMYTAGDRFAQQQPASSSKGMFVSVCVIF